MAFMNKNVLDILVLSERRIIYNDTVTIMKNITLIAVPKIPYSRPQEALVKVVRW